MNGVGPSDVVGALDEEVLRRALRLEPDERPGRSDLAAVLAAADRWTTRDRIRRRTGRGLALVVAGIGIEGAIAVAVFDLLAPLDVTGPLSVALSLVAAVAQRAVVIGQYTADPSVAIAVLAAVLFATIFERGSGRETVRARSS